MLPCPPAQALPRRPAASQPAGRLGALQEVAAAGPVLLRGHHAQARGGQRALALGADQREQPVGVRVVVAAARLDRVAEVRDQLAALPGRDVGARLGDEAGGRERGGHPARRAGDATGNGADVEDPGHRCAVLLDDAGLEVALRHHHADALHVREEPEQRRLVCHSVLQRHHGRARRERRDEVLHGRLRLVALDRQQHGGGTGEVGLGHAAHRGYVDGALAVRAATVRPCDRIASRWAPRATSVTSSPASYMRAPRTPPTAPAP